MNTNDTEAASHGLYVALARMLREHDQLTRLRLASGEPPALTNECIYMAKTAIENYEIKLFGVRS